MSKCGICRAGTDDQDGATLCHKDALALELAIAELPALMHQLRVAVTRQARVFRTSTRRYESIEWDDPEAAVAARLRSRDGRTALPATAMPIDIDAAALNTEAWKLITDWAVTVAELAGRPPLPPPVTYPPRLYISRNRAHWTDPGSATYRLEPSTLCTWLVAGVERLRLDPAGPRAYRQFTRLRRRIESTVDMHPPGEFVGKCDAVDVRMERVRLAGPPCAPFSTCGHETCHAIRAGVHRLRPHAGACGAELYAREGETTITCDVCGAEYDAAARRRTMATTVDDEWARPHTIAKALSQLEHTVKPDTLRKWIERDARIAGRLNGRPAPYPLILQRGVDDDGKPIYRVGDVRARIEWIRTERESA